MQAILLVLSAALVIAGSLIYCVSIVRGRTRPHRITRLVLAFVLALNFISILAAKGNPGAMLYAGIIFIFGLVFLFLSLGRGMGGTTVFDWICFVIAMAGVIGWQMTNNPALGIWMASLADFVAYIPAFVKTWHHPHTETPWLYILSGSGAFLSLIAYRIGVESLLQIVIVSSAWIMIACIYHKNLADKLRGLRV
jgi:hypothetical protein